MIREKLDEIKRQWNDSSLMPIAAIFFISQSNQVPLSDLAWDNFFSIGSLS